MPRFDPLYPTQHQSPGLYPLATGTFKRDDGDHKVEVWQSARGALVVCATAPSGKRRRVILPLEKLVELALCE